MHCLAIYVCHNFNQWCKQFLQVNVVLCTELGTLYLGLYSSFPAPNDCSTGRREVCLARLWDVRIPSHELTSIIEVCAYFPHYSQDRFITMMLTHIESDFHKHRWSSTQLCYYKHQDRHPKSLVRLRICPPKPIKKEKEKKKKNNQKKKKKKNIEQDSNSGSHVHRQCV